jgi:glutamate-5-semialdehyde dehydrogenase
MDCKPLFYKAQKAGRKLLDIGEKEVNNLLLMLADLAEVEKDFILAENEKDLALTDRNNPMYDRLQLTAKRISGIASEIRNVASLPSPLGRVISDYNKENGLSIKRVSVPFGVIGVIYEARPNVTFDVFSLCIKSGNACLLKGGSDAINSNSAIVRIIKKALKSCGIDEDAVTLLPPGREETIQMLNARGYVDLIIPRGSQGLIEYVRENSTVPVIETGAGICHVYFDKSGDIEKGKSIVHNSKTRRVSVCNALDCLIIHSSRLHDLSALLIRCAGSEVELFADERSYKALKGDYPSGLLNKATKKSYGTEFLSMKMAVKTVDSEEEALIHISEYGSGHSEAIVSEDEKSTDLFLRKVDAAAVYSNAPTAFTDGAEFGLGAEIGISTQKLHARGPMALEAMTTYKWIVRGNGQTRS